MTKLTPEQEMTEFRLKYPTPDQMPEPIDEELIAQARGLCEKLRDTLNLQIESDLEQCKDLEKYAIENRPLAKQIAEMRKMVADFYQPLSNLATTHLAEIDEHKNYRGLCDSCDNGVGGVLYPCDFLVTKAKRLLGVK